jgi:hypothetical protein
MVTVVVQGRHGRDMHHTALASAAALFVLRAGILPADQSTESHLALPPPARQCHRRPCTDVPTAMKKLHEFDAATNAMHDSELPLIS